MATTSLYLYDEKQWLEHRPQDLGDGVLLAPSGSRKLFQEYVPSCSRNMCQLPAMGLRSRKGEAEIDQELKLTANQTENQLTAEIKIDCNFLSKPSPTSCKL